MTAKFEPTIRDNYIVADMYRYSTNTLIIKITSTYPITSPINITYSAQGTYFVDDQDEWGGSQPPTEYFECRTWKMTLGVGKTEWSDIFMPDIYGERDPGLPGKANIQSIDSWYMKFTEFSDSNFNYKMR